MGLVMKDFFEERAMMTRSIEIDSDLSSRWMATSATSTQPPYSASSATFWEERAKKDVQCSKGYRTTGKRAVDLMLVLFSLPFWLPVLALCALALWLEGGKPFFRQERLGRTGTRFGMLKLRTMVPDADKVLKELCEADAELRAEWDTHQKLRNDPRITPVGRVLRASSLDELPQLINVLSGEMSLVGPRPMMPEQLPLYGDPQAYFAVRPGITGPWQVGERNNSTFSYRHGIDALYESELSFVSDTTILFKTVGVVLRRTGC